MCIGIPGQIISVDGTSAEVDFGGTKRTISLLMLEGIADGDWIVAHSGYAVKKLTETQAHANIECVVDAMEVAGSKLGDGREQV